MPDILLIQPPIRDFYITAKRTMPYGLACIAAGLRRDGFSVAVFDALATDKKKPVDFPEAMGRLLPHYGRPDVSPFALFHDYRHFGYDFQHIGKVARESGASLIGISSLFTPYWPEAETVARIVRKNCPRAGIVMGGHHPTALCDSVMACNAVDFVIRGEGEIPFRMLARALKDGGPVDSVPGIVFRNPDGSLHIRPPAFTENLDALPMPAMDLVHERFYRRGPSGAAVIMTGRGCSLSCSYCSVGATTIPYRRRSVASVMAEIGAAVEDGSARFIDFEDENLTFEKKWFSELMQGIIARLGYMNLELRAMNGLFPPAVHADMLPLMRRAGFRTLNLALGSTSTSRLREFRRPDVRPAIEALLPGMQRNDLNAVCYILIGAPGQSPDESLDDLLYLAGLPVLAGLSVFYPSPGSLDYERCAKNGILPGDVSLMRSTAFPVVPDEELTDVVTLLRLGRILNFMKHLLDLGEPLPRSRPFNASAFMETSDRTQVGRMLLQAFLQDGVIRGVTNQGECHEHPVSLRLTRRFIEEFQRRGIKGSRMSPWNAQPLSEERNPT